MNQGKIGVHLRIIVRSAAGLVLVAGIVGCDKKPGGQVAAVVDNVEITQQELRAEAEGMRQQPGQDAQAARAPILQRIIDRNLLAGYARKEGLDRGPEFVARRRQIEEALLADLAVRKLVGAQPTPTAAQVRDYVAKNPTLFAGRQRLDLDQLRFATPGDAKKIQALTKLGSLDAIGAQLKAEGVAFQRAPAVLDTASIDPAVARQIVALPNGEIFDVSTGGTTFISAITNRAGGATSEADWTPAATEALRRERAAKTLATAMTKLRKDAKIEYDPAFKPK